MPLKSAAREGGFPYTSLRDAHFRGELAVIRIGRAWYVEVEEMARFVQRQTVRHTAVVIFAFVFLVGAA